MRRTTRQARKDATQTALVMSVATVCIAAFALLSWWTGLQLDAAPYDPATDGATAAMLGVAMGFSGLAVLSFAGAVFAAFTARA